MVSGRLSLWGGIKVLCKQEAVQRATREPTQQGAFWTFCYFPSCAWEISRHRLWKNSLVFVITNVHTSHWASFSKGILSSRDRRGDPCKQASSDPGRKGSENALVPRSGWLFLQSRPRLTVLAAEWFISHEQGSGSWRGGGILVLCGIHVAPSPHRAFQIHKPRMRSFPPAHPQKALLMPLWCLSAGLVICRSGSSVCVSTCHSLY